MTSETYVTGGVAIWDKPEVGAVVRRFAATMLRPAGHLEAEVRRQRDGRFKVLHAEAIPQTARPFYVKVALEAYLNEASNWPRD